MNPAATGLIFTEFTVRPDGLEGFRPFHSGEHVHERLAIGGVVGARRYVSVVGDNHFLGLYRATSTEVFLGTDYKAMGARPSEETKRQGAFISGTRFVGDVVSELGDSFGGYAFRVRIAREPDADHTITDWFTDTGRRILATPTIARMMLARPRPGVENVSDDNWIVFIEGSVPGAFETLPVPESASTHTFRLEEMWINT